MTNKIRVVANAGLVISIVSMFISIYGLVGIVSAVMGFIVLAKDKELEVRGIATITIVLSLISIIYAYLMMNAQI